MSLRQLFFWIAPAVGLAAMACSGNDSSSQNPLGGGSGVASGASSGLGGSWPGNGGASGYGGVNASGGSSVVNTGGSPTGGASMLAVGGSALSTGGTSTTTGASGGSMGSGGRSSATGGAASGGTSGTGSTKVVGGSTAIGGTNGVAGSTATGGTAGIGGSSGTSVIWPNDQSFTNSDNWLVQNHDRIKQLRPRVLAMDLANTTNAATLIQRHIDGLANATSFHKYSNASAQAMLVYQLVKVVHATGPDYATWNTQAFADSNIQIKDPANPTGPNLTLCQLFEKGVINEVWCMATQNQNKCGESQETKVVYTSADPPVKSSPQRIVGASNGDNITGLGCKVSVRIIDFNTSRGVGCHQHAMGHAWERYMDAGAIPLLRKQASRFLNWDLNTRVGAPFSNFYSACNSNGSQLTDCMIWDSQLAMHSGPSAASKFTISDMSGGCGNAHFYPNTTGTYSYDATTPDPSVLASCEHYGMHDGPNGKDITTPFTNKMTDDLARTQQAGPCTAGSPYCSTDDDCGGHGTSYLYQSFPNFGTRATNDDGTPMHNWWVYLFY